MAGVCGWRGHSCMVSPSLCETVNVEMDHLQKTHTPSLSSQILSGTIAHSFSSSLTSESLNNSPSKNLVWLKNNFPVSYYRKQTALTLQGIRSLKKQQRNRALQFMKFLVYLSLYVNINLHKIKYKCDIEPKGN